MTDKLSIANDPFTTSECPVCNAVPAAPTDQFCRRCGCRLNLTCRHCHARIKALDRYCASCGARRLIIFDQIRQGAYNYTNIYVAIGTAVVLGSAWLALRYALRDKLYRL